MSTTTGADSQKRLIVIAATIIVALLAVNVVLMVNRNKHIQEKQEFAAQRDDAEQLKAELEKEYYAALSELEEMRGSNEELNALIESQQAELKEQKTQIERLLRSKNDYDRARTEIGKLNEKVQQYVAEINQLKQENELLLAENSNLAQRADSLSTNLQTERSQREELQTVQAELISQKAELEETNQALSKKTTKASVVEAENIDMTGYAFNKNGKPSKKNKAKNIEQLQVCFDIVPNTVAEAGTEVYMIRILNPLGETLAINDLGSGVFMTAAGQEVRYTMSKQIDYHHAAEQLCANWKPGQSFVEGNYLVEVYNKGYLAGSTTVQLK